MVRSVARNLPEQVKNNQSVNTAAGNGGQKMSQYSWFTVYEKTKDLMAAHSCSAEAKAAAQAWLDAAGTDKEAEETARYIEELEADIMPVDNLIAFAESEMGAKVFGGEEAAKGVAEHGRQIKAAGGKYCDCPACAAVAAILEKKEEMLK